jgi:hypothetical protein
LLSPAWCKSSADSAAASRDSAQRAAQRGEMGKLRVLCVAAALARARAVGLGVVQNLVFAALSDWGGQAESPFTTPGQLASAAALGRVADTERPKFVVSAGGNFLPQGLPGATPRRAARAAPPCAGERR